MKYSMLLIPILVFSCDQSPVNSSKKLTIGFSQCTIGDAWRETMNEEMRKEIGYYSDYDIELIIKDANNNNDQQIQDIKELVGLGIDILIVSPNEAEPLTEVVEEVYDQGTPVIVVDRRISSDKFTAFIGGDNFGIGKGAARFAAELLDGKGKILEITGLLGSTPAIERSLGFYDGLSDYPDIEVAKSLEGAWLLERAQEHTHNLFGEQKDFDLIYAHNDPMAWGAYLSTQDHGIRPFIIGVDGLATPNGGIEMVLEGSIMGTFLYPTGGDRAIQLALEILEEKPFSKVNNLKTIKIDYNNAKTLKLQAEQIDRQQARIDKLKEQLDAVVYLQERENTVMNLYVVISALLAAMAVMIIYFLYQKSRAS